MKIEIQIKPKPEILDPQGKAVSKSLHALGFSEVKNVHVGKWIEVDVSDDIHPDQLKARVSEMCEKLLANLVIENFHFEIKK